MNTLRQAVAEYLTMRRNLGFQLREAGKALLDFVTFMEQQHAPYITQALALATSRGCSTRLLGAAIEQRAWICPLSQFDRSTHADSSARFVTVQAKASSALSLLK